MALLGRAMAQETEANLLDEPKYHLDIRRQILPLEFLSKIEMLRVVVFRDLNLAARRCGPIVLLGGGRIRKAGSPDETINKEGVASVYGLAVDAVRHSANSRPVVLV